MSHQPPYQTYPLGDFALQTGNHIPQAHLAYKTYGDPRNPTIIYPTWFSGLIADNEWLIGEEKTLNPTRYCIIIPALFGNGESSSPSNRPDLRPFPHVSFYDNVRAQHALVTQHLGIQHVRAVLGWSMGAAQSFQWATQYPDFMDLVVPFCGSARTSLHNRVFLEGVKSAVLAGRGAVSGGVCKGESGKGQYRGWSEEEREVGLKALGRVYAGWGFSQVYPENMLVMLHTWQAGDCSDQEPYQGDFSAAMRGIRAKTLVLPCKTDLYFPPEDSEIEVKHMRDGIGELKVFPSIWGHWAGGPGQSTEDVKWLDERLREFFESN
ncbi:homoserine O-acetyltransferase [Hortaea werneckii]|nr:homoserine O-acetyltransferase [Hortaea werneckii]KAI7568489.1 homoserine O-acetyltransferase [Hortaea werneckii]KAI7617645.1 homoserine O-acetyltransferase [Hortaea werneckii]KAI7631850.1 homoserine O-acetyltransferase [Hortaea werneckii]KAI7664705.1 homoserine O-acetyltransferase [Hortaea werneckii]